jgi:voltage-gated sodium channel
VNRRWDSIAARCARIADSGWFTAVVFGVILFNAAILGAETYERLEARHGHTLALLNDACLGVFVVELTIRIAAYGRRPLEFFRSGWNLFDFVVVAAGFTPGLGRDTTVLRLVRLARVVRVVSILPDLRLLIVAIGRSIPPLVSLAVMAILLVYVYGIVGWLLFGQALPDRWGDIGTAMLNLFVMLTLENLVDNLEAAMRVHSWAWIFIMSYVLAASFLLLNILIGVVINSMEEARAIEHRREREERMAARRTGERSEEALAVADARDQAEVIASRLGALRDALEDLEAELKAHEPRPAPVEGGRPL